MKTAHYSQQEAEKPIQYPFYILSFIHPSSWQYRLSFMPVNRFLTVCQLKAKGDGSPFDRLMCNEALDQ